MKSPLIRLSHERPMRCPLCDARIGGNEMGIRAHLRRHLRELTGKLEMPHTTFLKFLGSEYWRTSIFEDYARKHMKETK